MDKILSSVVTSNKVRKRLFFEYDNEISNIYGKIMLIP